MILESSSIIHLVTLLFSSAPVGPITSTHTPPRLRHKMHNVDPTSVRRLILLSLIGVIALVGIPVWWNTTTVYRATLPNLDTWSAMTTNAFDVQVNVFSTFKGMSSNINGRVLEHYHQAQKAHETAGTGKDDTAYDGTQFKFRFNDHAWDQKDAGISKDTDITTQDSILHKKHPTHPSEYNLFVVCSTSQSTTTQDITTHIGQFRNLFIHSKSCDKGVHWLVCSVHVPQKRHPLTRQSHTTSPVPRPDAISRSASELISSIFLSELSELSDIKDVNELSETKTKTQRTPPSFPFSPQHQLTLSLLVDDGKRVQWNVEEMVHDYISPFLKLLSPLYEFQVSSQILYYASLASELTKPSSSRNASHSEPIQLTPAQLRNFINNDWTLGSLVNKNPQIHLILYVPSNPVQVVSSDSSVVSTNAFLVPRWGGIVIRNLDASTHETSINDDELFNVASIWIRQLRSLLGVSERLHLLPTLPTLQHLQLTTTPSQIGISLYELDALIRKAVVESRRQSVDTLKSLITLCNEMGNMVVEDKIAKWVEDAVRELEKNTTSLLPTLASSKSAYQLSSQAFFDKSMVPLLYFPDEHKFAIYMPLFVPGVVPLLVALLREVKDVLKKRKERKLKNQTNRNEREKDE